MKGKERERILVLVQMRSNIGLVSCRGILSVSPLQFTHG